MMEPEEVDKWMSSPSSLEVTLMSPEEIDTARFSLEGIFKVTSREEVEFEGGEEGGVGVVAEEEEEVYGVEGQSPSGCTLPKPNGGEVGVGEGEVGEVEVGEGEVDEDVIVVSGK